MTHLALTHRDHNELQQAEELLRSASGVLEASGVPHHRSLALSSLGLVLVDRGHTSEARELFERAVAINEEAGDAYGLAIATGHRARVHLATRDLDLAQSDAQRCLVYNEVFNSKEGMAIGTLLLGQVALARGDTDGTASSYLLQSVTISTDIRHQFFSLVAKCDLACAYLAEGHELMASNLYRQCVDLATTTQVRLAARYVESKQLSFPSRKYYQ
jgi:ATP/maltotriose-dependent transcriptional regulator MalT